MKLNTRVYAEIEKDGYTYYFSMPFGAQLSDSVQVMAEMHNQLVGMIKNKVKENNSQEQQETGAEQQNADQSEGKIIHD